MIQLLHWLGLLSDEQAHRLQKSHVPLRASTLANAGLGVMVLAFLAAMTSCMFGLLSSPLFQLELPLPPEPPSTPAPKTELMFPDQKARDAFRIKVDRLQQQLDRLVTRQAELENMLALKTSESRDLTSLTERLREELRFKEREINALTQHTEPRRRVDRKIVSGTTEYLPRASEEIKGFIVNHDQEIGLATTPTELPAELIIALTPADAQPGDAYRLEVQIHNRGNHSVHLTGLELIWNYAGKNTGGSIPFRERTVRPRSSELLHQVEGVWFEDLHAGTIIATVTLKEGGRLQNSLSWSGG